MTMIAQRSGEEKRMYLLEGANAINTKNTIGLCGIFLKSVYIFEINSNM
jgi:hypothetical protein